LIVLNLFNYYGECFFIVSLNFGGDWPRTFLSKCRACGNRVDQMDFGFSQRLNPSAKVFKEFFSGTKALLDLH
jgi:hypothetical protein